jgi:hypothetical protein
MACLELTAAKQAATAIVASATCFNRFVTFIIRPPDLPYSLGCKG